MVELLASVDTGVTVNTLSWADVTTGAAVDGEDCLM